MAQNQGTKPAFENTISMSGKTVYKAKANLVKGLDGYTHVYMVNGNKHIAKFNGEEILLFVPHFVGGSMKQVFDQALKLSGSKHKCLKDNPNKSIQLKNTIKNEFIPISLNKDYRIDLKTFELSTF